jgi:tRNA A-37 threonylcarbamoyl transferase component Bud32
MSSWSSNNKTNLLNINNSVLNKIKSNVFQKHVNLVYLNSGKNGKVYSIKQNQQKVLKVSKFTQNSNLEAMLSQKASNSNIGPTIYNTKIVEGYQVILQEKMHGTLQEYMNKHTFTMDDYRNIENLVQQLHKLGICHKDLHLKNIMYKLQNGKTIFKIIDFSRARIINNNENCFSDRTKLNNLHRRVNTRSSNLKNTTPPTTSLLDFTSANFRTPI